MRIIKELFVASLGLGFLGTVGLAWSEADPNPTTVEAGVPTTHYSQGAEIGVSAFCHIDKSQPFTSQKAHKMFIVCTVDGQAGSAVITQYFCNGSWRPNSDGGYTCGTFLVFGGN